MLGVCLLFVGIVLINNGMCTLYKLDGKATAVMNLLTGGLSIFINAVKSCHGQLLCRGHRPFVWLYISLCSFYEAVEIKSHSLCLVSTFVAVNAIVSERSKGLPEARPLGSHRTGAGQPSGICGRSSGELLLWKISATKTWKICACFAGY